MFSFQIAFAIPTVLFFRTRTKNSKQKSEKWNFILLFCEIRKGISIYGTLDLHENDLETYMLKAFENFQPSATSEEKVSGDLCEWYMYFVFNDKRLETTTRIFIFSIFYLSLTSYDNLNCVQSFLAILTSHICICSYTFDEL